MGSKGSKSYSFEHDRIDGITPDAFMREVNKTEKGRQKFEEDRQNILIPRFGTDYEKLLDIQDKDVWKVTLLESLIVANTLPKVEDSVAQKLESTKEAMKTIDELSIFYKTHLTNSYVKNIVREALEETYTDLWQEKQDLKVLLRAQKHTDYNLSRPRPYVSIHFFCSMYNYLVLFCVPFLVIKLF